MTIGVLVAIAGALSGGIGFAIFRLRKPYAKLLGVVVGLLLFVLFAWGGFVLLIVESARRGHPF